MQREHLEVFAAFEEAELLQVAVHEGNSEGNAERVKSRCRGHNIEGAVERHHDEGFALQNPPVHNGEQGVNSGLQLLPNPALQIVKERVPEVRMVLRVSKQHASLQARDAAGMCAYGWTSV